MVNGRTEFIGSQEGTLRNAIRTNLQKPAAAQLRLDIGNTDKKQATIKYAAEGTDKNTVLQVAVLQKAATTKVERGENGGRTLSHVQIVRHLQTVALRSESGTVNIALPVGYDGNNWEIIGFLQNRTNGAIIAAAKASLPGNAMAAATGSM